MITALAFSPTAPELAVGGYSGVLQLWHVAGPPRLERPLMGLQGAAGYPEAIQAIAFSRDGKLLAATNSAATNAPGSYQQQFLATLAIWHAHSGELLSYPSQLDPVNQPGSYDALAISPNGRLLAASVPGGSDVLHPLDTEDTTALAFAPNGTLATGALAGIVQLWNPASGAAISSPLAVSAGPVTSIAFNPTGDQFATTGSQNGTAKLWSTSTLQEEGTRRRAARRQQRRHGIHLAHIARRLGTTRMHRRGTQPHPAGVGPIRHRTALHTGLPVIPGNGSHAPHDTRTDPGRNSQNRAIKAVLPTPASPATNTSLP